MEKFMKCYYIKKILYLEKLCRYAFFEDEYPNLMMGIDSEYSYNGTTDLINTMKEADCYLLFMFLSARYSYIYQNAIVFMCMKLFQMGVFDSFCEKQEYLKSDLPAWNDLFIISGLENANKEVQLRENLVKTLMNEAGWSMYTSYIVINTEDYNEYDNDYLYHDIISQACRGSEKYELVIKAAKKDHEMKDVVLDFISENELEGLNMIVFVSDRKNSTEQMQAIFQDFVSGQEVFYIESLDGVIIFFADTIENNGLSILLDAYSYNLFSVLYAYYISLSNPYKRIEARSNK